MTDDAPSIGTLAGQLGYLFEERPELAHATVAELVDQLNHEDRYARARQVVDQRDFLGALAWIRRSAG